MANISLTTPTDYSARQEEIARQQKLADYLQNQSLQPVENVGGNGASLSWTQGLAKMLQAYSGAKQGQEATTAKQALAQEQQLNRQQDVQKYASLLNGSPMQVEGGGQFNRADQTQTETTPPIAPNAGAARAALIGSRDPGLQQMGMQLQMKDSEPYTLNQGDQRMIGPNVVATGQPKRVPPITRSIPVGDGTKEQMMESTDNGMTWQNLGAPSPKFSNQVLNVNAGASRVPPGYRMTADGNMEAVPGGPADQKFQGKMNVDTAALNTSTNSMDRLAAAANGILNHPGLAGITGIRGAVPNIPGTAAADAAAAMNTLKSQVAFGVLQEMRNNSKTGGALGQVSDKEGQLLQSNLAALDGTQSEAQMKKSLKAIIDYANGAKDRLHAAYNLKYDEAPTQNRRASDQTPVRKYNPVTQKIE